MPPIVVNLSPKYIGYRDYTIIIRIDACNILKSLAWYADVEPPTKDGIYRGSSWLEKQLAIDAAINFIDAFIDNAFPPGWEPVKEMYANS